MLERIAPFAPRFAVLSLVVTAALWCGGIFKSMLHQAATYQLRSLTIGTFQSFRDSAIEDSVKDAVVSEATKAVFRASPTGLVSSKGDSDSQMVSLTNLLPKPD